jgi:hypothetical protein
MASVSAIQVKTGSPAPPAFDKTDCDELGDKNVEERDKLDKNTARKAEYRKLTKADAAAQRKAQTTGMTFSSAKVNVGIAGGGSLSGTPTGCSSAKAFQRSPGGVVKGGTSDMKQGKEGVLCGMPKYKHTAGGFGAHAEAKIVNDLTEMAQKSGSGTLQGGSMLLNIDWRFKRDNAPQGSGMPCEFCFEMLCHAAKKCEIDIYICDAEGNPQKFPKDCDQKDKDPANDPYEKLSRQVDGGFPPGR